MNKIIRQNKFFTAYAIASGVTRIQGLALENCYLVEGKERALLIDGLTGIGSLRAFVRELTELPLTVALSHGHLDHSGIAWESSWVYVHPDDVFLMRTEEMSGVQERKDFAELYHSLGVPFRTEVRKEDVLPSRPLWTLPLRDGDILDLGGVSIEVIGVPGHTRGSLVFLDRVHRCVYAGDACNANTLLNLDGSTSIAEYKKSLEHFWTYEKEFDVLWTGHDCQAVPGSIVRDGIALCGRILARQDDAIEVEERFGGKALLAARRREDYSVRDGSLCNIVYKPETIYESPRSEL